MPTYEYRCPDGHDFEHFVLRISEASSVMACPRCGASAVRKISAGGGLVFKGSGFYITDYGKDGKKDQRERPAAASAGGKSGGEGDGGSSAPEAAGSTAAGGKADAGKPAGTGKDGPAPGASKQSPPSDAKSSKSSRATKESSSPASKSGGGSEK